MAGKKALGAWFHRCRSELGDVEVGVFGKLMSSLVESTMLYGAEIWGCNRDLEKIEQVQMRALRLCSLALELSTRKSHFWQRWGTYQSSGWRGCSV